MAGLGVMGSVVPVPFIVKSVLYHSGTTPQWYNMDFTVHGIRAMPRMTPADNLRFAGEVIAIGGEQGRGDPLSRVMICRT